jgi:hypothetical protein
MSAHTSPLSSFELLELPDGRCYVAHAASASATELVAGSFARLDPPLDELDAACTDPVGIYASRDEAEIAIIRASPSLRAVEPLAAFAPWLRQD